jgi:hypothetical protein
MIVVSLKRHLPTSLESAEDVSNFRVPKGDNIQLRASNPRLPQRTHVKANAAGEAPFHLDPLPRFD